MIRSPIKWVGGKSKLRKTILPMIPEHECYVEVFGGAGWILFAKDPSRVEVLNDIDGELMNFFYVVKHEPDELIRSFRLDLASREEFNRLLALDPTSLSRLERAHRFFYLIMSSWGGELDYARFQTSISDGGHGNRLIGALDSLEKRIRPAHDRLKTVIIENLTWQECIDRYDDPRTFFYLDPPYLGNKCNYKHNMRSLDEHAELAARLESVQGRWLLSAYDTEEARDLFVKPGNADRNDFCHPVTFPSGLDGNNRKNVELLITNYQVAP